MKWVYDGDTLKLSDGTKLRILGVDTPEMARKNKAAEPLAAQATEALREKLFQHNYHIYYRTDSQKYDKYNRVLAHVFTPDQTNLSLWLLKEGFATTLLLPPNWMYDECYIQAERQAQIEKRGIWNHPKYQIISTTSLPSQKRSYVRLKGTISKIRYRKKHLSLTLDEQIYITIKEPTLSHMHSIDSLKDKTVIISGMLYQHKQRASIRLHHPGQLRIIND